MNYVSIKPILYLRSSECKLFQSDHIAPLGLHGFILLFLEQILEGVDELQVGGRCHIVVSAQLLQESVQFKQTSSDSTDIVVSAQLLQESVQFKQANSDSTDIDLLSGLTY